MKAADIIAEFIVKYPSENIPDTAVDLVQTAILDYSGALLAGINEESSKIVRDIVVENGGNPCSSIFGTDIKTSPNQAALANGTTAHSLDYDDINPVMGAHPSIQLLPGLFALAESEKQNGKDLISAYVIGFEIGGVLGHALNPAHLRKGWLPIGTIGVCMQAAACSRLLKLTESQTMAAIGIAANFASGLRCNSGTMAKHFLAGHAASSGVKAALAARGGMTANPNTLEDQFGFLENFTGGERIKMEGFSSTLGSDWEILNSGLFFKRFPCCAGSHIAVECALDIVERYSPMAEDIESVDIFAHAGLQNVLIHPMPRNVSEARFSLEYAVSRAILDGKLGPGQFHPNKVEEPLVIDLMRKINPIYQQYNLTREDIESGRFPVEIKVRLKDGTELLTRKERSNGTSKDLNIRRDIDEKFALSCADIFEGSRIKEMIKIIHDFETLDDISEFTRLMEPSSEMYHKN